MTKQEAEARAEKIMEPVRHKCEAHDWAKIIAGVSAALENAAREAPLREAVRRLYYAAVWHADRPVDEAKLWTDVRDAAGFEPGHSPAPEQAPGREERCLRCGWLREEHNPSPALNCSSFIAPAMKEAPPASAERKQICWQICWGCNTVHVGGTPCPAVAEREEEK